MWFIPNAITGIYATMGEKEKALKMLKDYKSWIFMRGEHDAILKDATFKNLWDDPEFIDLVRQVRKKKRRCWLQPRELDGWEEIDL